jgi:hypothetical protein
MLLPNQKPLGRPKENLTVINMKVTQRDPIIYLVLLLLLQPQQHSKEKTGSITLATTTHHDKQLLKLEM